MKPKTSGLGKGLSAIFDMEEQNVQKGPQQRGASIDEIDIKLVQPNPTQPRTNFDKETLDELSQSIARLGVIQPITVCPNEDGTFMIISGERRFRASQLAGKKTIPAYVREASEDSVLEMALVENIQREDLNAMEIAFTLQRLVEEFNLTQENLADRVGKKRSTVTNFIRLLKLPAEIQLAIREDVISMGHARALLSLPSPEAQVKMLERILKSSLSVRQVEQIVKDMATPQDKPAKKRAESSPAKYNTVKEHLSGIWGDNITVHKSTAGDVKIVIKLKSEGQLDDILKDIKRK